MEKFLHLNLSHPLPSISPAILGVIILASLVLITHLLLPFYLFSSIQLNRDSQRFLRKEF